jgi:hypothetical protein
MPAGGLPVCQLFPFAFAGIDLYAAPDLHDADTGWAQDFGRSLVEYQAKWEKSKNGGRE